MNLARFLDAQAPIYADALAELRAGKKRTHCSLRRPKGARLGHPLRTACRASGRAIRLTIYALPRSVRGLGHSHNATYYGIEDAAEAAADLAHPVLGARLRECVAALLAHQGKSAHAILGCSSRAQRAPAAVTHSAPMDRRSGANRSVDHLRLAAPSPDDLKFRSCLTLFATVVAQRAPAFGRLCAQTPLRSEAGAFAPTTSGLPPSAREVAAPDDTLWQSALDHFYAGRPDDATLRLLKSKR